MGGSDWLERFDGQGSQAPFWLGLAIVIGYLVIRCAFDGLFLITWGFPDGSKPLWETPNWWTQIVNALLLGYIPAALLIARRGIGRDLDQLRSCLPFKDAEFADIRAIAIRPAGYVGLGFKVGGLFTGIALVFVDPTISQHSEPSLNNPAFLWALLQTSVFGWWIIGLFVADLKASRAYLHMGRNLIKVGLLDVTTLSAFAKRGLRSAFTWVIFSIIFSLFWVGDTASQANLYLFIAVLTMATTAFVVPRWGFITIYWR